MKITTEMLQDLAKKSAPGMRELCHETLLDLCVWADETFDKHFPHDCEDKELHKTMLVRSCVMSLVAYFVATVTHEGHREEFIDKMIEDIKISAALTGLFK